jgi:citrate/tricarballylate utilization protein
VPRTLARVRGESYKQYAWPRALSGTFDRNGLKISIITAVCMTAFVLGFVGWQDPAVVFGVHTGPGAFYKLMPHDAMLLIFGSAFLYAIFALVMGLVAFWRDIGEPAATLKEPKSLWQAFKDAGQLRYLDGGGMGCMNEDDRPIDNRKIYHHLTFYGFMLCLASTITASMYYYVLGKDSPYAWYELPVLLGTAGGIGLLIGPVGLLIAKKKRDPIMQDEARLGMDVAFIVMLFLTSLTGMLLLLLRATPLMSLLLAAHLGVVLSLFLTMPYGKFVHGIYRFAALVRYAKESRALSDGSVKA